MNVTTKFLINTIKVCGSIMWAAIIIKFRIIQVVGEILDAVFNF